MADYWKECISEALEDAGITATDDQVDTVACWAEGAHDNYGLATGVDVTTKNYYEGMKDEISALKKKLHEQDLQLGAIPDLKRIQGSKQDRIWELERIVQNLNRDIERERGSL